LAAASWRGPERLLESASDLVENRAAAKSSSSSSGGRFLVVVVVALPWLLSKLLSRGQERQEDVGLLSWLKGYMDIATGRLESRQFAIQVLIAPAAAVIGLVLIAVVRALVA
jgi:hypothetical protein